MAPQFAQGIDETLLALRRRVLHRFERNGTFPRDDGLAPAAGAIWKLHHQK
jgi:hypothetical protein